jgi:hypothetical protein
MSPTAPINTVKPFLDSGGIFAIAPAAFICASLSNASCTNADCGETGGAAAAEAATVFLGKERGEETVEKFFIPIVSSYRSRIAQNSSSLEIEGSAREPAASTRRVYALRKARRSALSWLAWVTVKPCGAPG